MSRKSSAGSDGWPRCKHSVWSGIPRRYKPSRRPRRSRSSWPPRKATAAAPMSSPRSTRLSARNSTMVKGYKSVSESGLAMERGEVQGISSTSWEYVDSKAWIKQKEVGFLYIIGSERNPKIPDTPTFNELSGNDGDRAVLRSIASAADIGRAILTPPNAPADRMDPLRDAFATMLRDPDFIRDAERRSLEIGPMGGTELQKLILQAMDVTPEVAERTRRAIRE